MSRMTAPAPIFNFRKRQRQALFADPHSQAAKPQDQRSMSEEMSSHQQHGSSFSSQSMVAGRGRDIFDHGPPPRTRPGPSTSTHSSTLQPSGPGLKQTTGNYVQKVPTVARTAHDQSLGRGQQNTLQHGGAFAGNTLPPSGQTQQGQSVARAPHGQMRGGGAGQSPWQRGRGSAAGNTAPRISAASATATSCLSVTSSRPQSLSRSYGSPAQKVVSSGRKDAAMSSDKTLKVWTLTISHVKRLFHLQNDVLPPHMVILYGRSDSATVSDKKTSMKSFLLRDETESITCFFCEIDRQMPRLHRGHWYRVVCVLRPTRQAVQCLSLRPVSKEERQAAHKDTARSTAYLNNAVRNVTEQ